MSVTALVLAAGAATVRVAQAARPARRAAAAPAPARRARRRGDRRRRRRARREAAAIEAAIAWRGERRRINERPQTGSRARCGSGSRPPAEDPGADAVLVVLGDQPGLRPEVIRAVIAAAETTNCRSSGRATAGRRPEPGPRAARGVGARRARGSRGLGRSSRPPGFVHEVGCGVDPGLDTPADLAAAILEAAPPADENGAMTTPTRPADKRPPATPSRSVARRRRPARVSAATPDRPDGPRPTLEAAWADARPRQSRAGRALPRDPGPRLLRPRSRACSSPTRGGPASRARRPRRAGGLRGRDVARHRRGRRPLCAAARAAGPRGHRGRALGAMRARSGPAWTSTGSTTSESSRARGRTRSDELGELPAADVSLIAHVGYDIEAIGPFLDAMERATRTRCLAMLTDRSPASVADPFWPLVHGEDRVAAAALPDLVERSSLAAATRWSTVVERSPRSFDSVGALTAFLRRQLFIAEGGEKDVHFRAILPDHIARRDGAWTLCEPAPGLARHRHLADAPPDWDPRDGGACLTQPIDAATSPSAHSRLSTSPVPRRGSLQSGDDRAPISRHTPSPLGSRRARPRRAPPRRKEGWPRMIPGQFDYVRPGTLDEALRILKDREGEAKVLSGATASCRWSSCGSPSRGARRPPGDQRPRRHRRDRRLAANRRARDAPPDQDEPSHRRDVPDDARARRRHRRPAGPQLGDDRRLGRARGSRLGLAGGCSPGRERDDRLPRPRRRARDQGPRLLPRHVHHGDRAH